MNSVLKAKLAEIEQYNRDYPRRSVLFKGRLGVNAFDFPCTVVDISLSGTRIKLDLPLATGAGVKLAFNGLGAFPAHVVWAKDGFLGLRFVEDADRVYKRLGPLSQKLFRQ